ncbi:GWxTD domain-containing protein [bacterium]|nr:GWxTD domain-containing protein [bacterium]
MIGKKTVFTGFLLFLCMFRLQAAGMAADASVKYYDSVIPEKLLYMPVFYAAGGPDSALLTLFWKISPAALQFVKNDSVFEGRYEFTAEIRNLKNEVLAREIRRNKIIVQDFRDSEDPVLRDQEPMQVFLRAGSYRLILEFFDLDTRKPAVKAQDLIIPEFFGQGLSCSRILFTRRPVVSGKPPSIPPAPVYPPFVSTEDSTTAACMVLYSTHFADTVRLACALLDHSGECIYEDSVFAVPAMPATLHAFPVPGRLPFGHYRFRVRATQGSRTCSSEESITIRWGNLPAELPDIGSAVESLVYIMPRERFAQIKSLNRDDQKKALEAFWKEHDPDPETPLNELEQEFYRRVVHAVQRYSLSTGLPGWKTDRGRIVILFGEPADVERRESPLNRNTRYEIWSYPHLRRSFLFEDRFGSGDFRLLSEETR